MGVAVRCRRYPARRWGWPGRRIYPGSVSIQVQLGELADAMAVYRFAYMVTMSDDGRAHVVAVTPHWDGGALVVDGIGRRSAANLAARPAVTLVWPPLEPAGYSLILDGQAQGGDGDAGNGRDAEPAGAEPAGAAVTIVPSRAVLHRPAPGARSAAGPDAGQPAVSGAAAPGCVSDCVEIGLGTG